MTAETTPIEKRVRKPRVIYRGGGSAFYGIGLIGALVYYLSTAASFMMGVVGFFKALVWPAFLVFAAMKALGM
ncbi:hypothetical protein ACFLXB_05065 [Chloroflexota bacterium]